MATIVFIAILGSILYVGLWKKEIPVTTSKKLEGRAAVVVSMLYVVSLAIGMYGFSQSGIDTLSPSKVHAQMYLGSIAAITIVTVAVIIYVYLKKDTR